MGSAGHINVDRLVAFDVLFLSDINKIFQLIHDQVKRYAIMQNYR